MYKGNFEIESEITKMLEKDSDIILSSSFSIEQFWTKNWHMLFKRDEFFKKSFSKDIAERFDDFFMDEISDCKEDYLNVIDLDRMEIFDRLCKYLAENEFDFVIMNPLRSSSFITEVKDYSSRDLDNTNISKIKNYGLFRKRFEFFVNHDWGMDNDLIICGRKNCVKYNFIVDSVNYLENISEVEGTMNFRLDFKIDSENFTNLYLVTHISNKYLRFFRKDTIQKLL